MGGVGGEVEVEVPAGGEEKRGGAAGEGREGEAAVRGGEGGGSVGVGIAVGAEGEVVRGAARRRRGRAAVVAQVGARVLERKRVGGMDLSVAR